jgi:hypothetical protein
MIANFFMKDYLKQISFRSFAVAGIAFLTIAGTAAAATTIGSNIDTDGTLTVDGDATFDGDVLPVNAGDENLGSQTQEWSTLYLASGSTSGIRIGDTAEYSATHRSTADVWTFETHNTASLSTIDDALYTFAADADQNGVDDMTPDQEIFEVGKGSSFDSAGGGWNELFAIDEEGDVTAAGVGSLAGVLTDDGSASEVAYGFTDEGANNTGLYRIAEGNMALVANGSRGIEIESDRDVFMSNGRVKIGSSTQPNATLDVDGSVVVGARTVQGILSTQPDDHTLFVDTSTTTTTITLSSADVENGRTIVIKDAAGNAASNNITVNTEGSETIDGSSSYTLNNNRDTLVLRSDGTNWLVINRYF